MSRQDEFDCIVNSLNEAMLDETRWQDASALIDEAFGSKGSILAYGADHAGGAIEVFFTRCVYRGIDRTDWQRTYYSDYYATDEHLPRLRALPDRKIVHVTELFSEQELKTSRTYNEWLPLCHGQDGLNVRLDGPAGSRIIWGIADPVDADGWTGARLEMIANVLPHLRQYVSVYSTLADAGALGKSISTLLDNTRIGIVQLNRNARIIEASDYARDILRKNDGLSDRNGELYAAYPQDNMKLRKLLDQALAPHGVQASSGSMLVRRPSLLPRYVMHLKPVTLREADDRSQNVAALMLIADPVERAAIDPELIESVLGLTPAEAEVVVLLAEGHTMRQISLIKRRSYNTVRTHLAHAMTKLGVSRQYDVARLVLALANLPKS